MRLPLDKLLPWLLALALVVAYLPSLGGGFLNYDDPWLVQNNQNFKDPSLHALGTILFDLSREARMSLGAEYLPLRDLSHFIEASVFGISAPAMRIFQLLLYIGAMLAFRAALLRSYQNARVAEGGAWLFALHPVHVESVAWLAGRKDVLAMLFVGLALFLHAGHHRRRAVWVPILFALACLSKSMAIGALGLFLALDLLKKRPLHRIEYAALGLAGGAVLAVHVYVGGLVSMTTAPAGGTRFTAWLTMGGIWLDYLKLCFWPPALCIAHDPMVRTSLDPFALGGWFLLGASALWGVWRWRRGNAWPLALWLVFVVPLLPVSQVLFPLENLMADRYLFFSVLAPCLALALIASRNASAELPALALIGLGLLAATCFRAALFADSVALFTHATHKTRANVIAPYQLGQGLEAQGRDTEALGAYLLALSRESTPSEAGRRATNNAAKLLARKQRLGEAERLLREGRSSWPSDPKILANLAQVVARQRRLSEACTLAGELERSFPAYSPKEPWAQRCSEGP